MNARILTQIEELESLEGPWTELLQDSYNNVVQLTHDWIMAWWNHFGGGPVLSTIVVYNSQEEIIGIAPFLRSVGRYRNVEVKKIKLMANGHSPSSDLIIRKDQNVSEIVKTVWDTLMSLPTWDMIEFTKVDRNGHAFQAIAKFLKENRHLFGLQESIESPVIEMNMTWDAYWGSRSSKFRKTFRNKLNRAKRSGDLSVERHHIKAGTDPVLSDMVTVSEKSWKKQIGTDIQSNPDSKGFLIELCDRFGPKSLVTLWLLRKDATPIAFEFHLAYNRVAYAIRADYDEAYKDLSPGSVLEYSILKSLFDEGHVREYNSCGDSYNYLLRWTGNTVQHVNVEAFRGTLLPYGLYAFEYKLLPLLRRMKLNRIKDHVKAKGLI